MLLQESPGERRGSLPHEKEGAQNIPEWQKAVTLLDVQKLLVVL